MDGIILVNKPQNWTSFDVVAKVRGVLKKSGIAKPKVGHAGTLDPLATGLLVLLIGSYTKKSSELSKLDKTYEAEMKLGQTSTTGDEEGKKADVSDKKPHENEVNEAIKSFLGEIKQVPHAYSAVKVGGKRAYKLARAGKEVKIEPRKVTVYHIQNTKYRYPYLSFEARVSSGTYIRSLAEDIGAKLETGAYLTKLNRTQIGKFKLEDALEIEKLTDTKIQNSLQK